MYYDEISLRRDWHSACLGYDEHMHRYMKCIEHKVPVVVIGIGEEVIPGLSSVSHRGCPFFDKHFADIHVDFTAILDIWQHFDDAEEADDFLEATETSMEDYLNEEVQGMREQILNCFQEDHLLRSRPPR